MDCFSVDPREGHRFWQKTCFCMGFFPWDVDPDRILLLSGFSVGWSILQDIYACSRVGSSRGFRGTTCITVVFSEGCSRISAPVPGVPPPPPFHWPWCLQDSFSHIFSLPSFSCSCAVLFPLLKYVVTETVTTLLIGSALASSESTLEPAETSSVKHGGSFWCLLTKDTSAAPLLSKSCHVNPIQYCFTTLWEKQKAWCLKTSRGGGASTSSLLKSICSNKGKEKRRTKCRKSSDN